jgi:glycosyltransferase A (GT-A) superfamily protein (DUF2064 family)
VSDRTLVVFVKEPRPGAVKTRLAAEIGADAAALVYRALAEGVLEATTPRPGEYERLVFFEPPEARRALRAWLPGVSLRAQAGTDLGARLSDAFARELRAWRHARGDRGLRHPRRHARRRSGA